MSDLDKVYEDLDQESVASVLSGESTAPREVGAGAAPRSQVGAGGKPEDQKQLPASSGSGAPEDLVEDPLTGAMVPRSQLGKS
jgi:hypothetical protein